MRIGMIAAALAATLAAGSAFANEGVEARQKLMKAIGGDVKGIAGYVKGENQETPADVGKRAAMIKANAMKIGGAFNDEIHVENANGVETTASPAIWQKHDGFLAAASDLETAAGALEVTAAGGDKAAIAASFGAMTKTCGGCHTVYRVKKN